MHEAIAAVKPKAAPTVAAPEVGASALVPPGRGIEIEAEEKILSDGNEWVVEQGLPEGSILFELSVDDTGEPLAVLDLAWPGGLQRELSEPVAVLINETPDVHELANSRGYRYFTSVEAFRRYVLSGILGDEEPS